MLRVLGAGDITQKGDPAGPPSASIAYTGGLEGVQPRNQASPIAMALADLVPGVGNLRNHGAGLIDRF